MRNMLLWCVFSCSMFLLTACAQTVQTPSPAVTPLSPGVPILLIRTPLPPSVQYEVLGTIMVHKTSYGSADWALDQLAAEARAAGANAIMDVTIGFVPSWGGWATPQSTGTAILITAPSVKQVSQLPTVQAEWR